MFFSSDPIQRAVAAAWKACCGSWFANRHILKIIVRDKITALWTRNRGSGTLGNWETGKLGNWMAGMVRTAGLARMAGTAQTARTAWTVRTGWKIGQLGNWEIGKLENWEFSR